MVVYSEGEDVDGDVDGEGEDRHGRILSCLRTTALYSTYTYTTLFLKCLFTCSGFRSNVVQSWTR